jgi:calcineurin-like phosphoesterase family protein
LSKIKENYKKNMYLKNKNIFFTSDSHLHHNNICKGISNWSDKDKNCRDFNTLQEMDDAIIDGVNNNVGQDDILFHLGDVAWGAKYVKQYVDRLICKNIYLILGNHDTDIIKSEELQSLFKGVYRLLNIDLNGRHFVLCHYAMRVWNKSHHFSTHLYAHSHGKLLDLPNSLSMDVGIDTNKNLFPYHIDEINKIMDKKKEYILSTKGSESTLHHANEL